MISFYLITDSHYLSKRHWVEGKPFLHRIREDAIAINHSTEILDICLEEILADNDTDTVLFLGDNVDNGDITSHNEFKARLDKLTNAGKKVFMLYATHDYIGAGDDECNFQMPRRFTKSGTEPVEFMRKAKLPEFYYDYTRKNAESVDSQSGSYSVRLADNVLLFMLIDNGNGRSYCGLFDSSLEWLEKEIEAAREKGDIVIAAVHHPILPPWIVYEKAVPTEMVGGFEKLREIFCRNSVHLVFSGHTHVHSIKKHTDENGNWFYAVSTIALPNAFGKMRKVRIDNESGLCEIESIAVDIEKAAGTEREALYKQNFPGIWERLLPLAHKDFREFVNQSAGYLKSETLKKYKFVIKPISRQLDKMNLYKAAGLAGIRKNLNDTEKARSKNMYVKDAVFGVMRCLFAGNAPFTPDTLEYRIATGITGRIDRFNIKKLKKLMSGLTLSQAAEDVLYNNRTGNDDSISFYLR